MTIRAPHFSKREPYVREIDYLLATKLVLGTPLVILKDAGDKPFEQSDWITPPAVKIQTPVQRSTLLPLTVFAPPFIQSDWITPPAQKRPTPFQLSNPLALVIQPEPPFIQYDWFVSSAIPTQQPIQLPKSIALVEAPFLQQNWPNPVIVAAKSPDKFVRPIVLLEQVAVIPEFLTSDVWM